VNNTRILKTAEGIIHPNPHRDNAHVLSAAHSFRFSLPTPALARKLLPRFESQEICVVSYGVIAGLPLVLPGYQ
jgi:hypothetical protein